MTGPTERARDLLEALGPTPDAIAESLTAAGVTGWPCDSEDCVFTSYLRVNGVNPTWIDPEENDTGLIGFADTPPLMMWPALSEFGQRFDQEEWPALVGAPVQGSDAGSASPLSTDRS